MGLVPQCLSWVRRRRLPVRRHGEESRDVPEQGGPLPIPGPAVTATQLTRLCRNLGGSSARCNGPAP